MIENQTKKNNDKGITLIALVITIIVLLILAGISIAFLTGENGIISRATNAKFEKEKSEIKEMLGLSVNTIAIEQKQKQDDLANYYKEQETFVEKGKFDTSKYKINNYKYNDENKIITITIYKENGTKNQYEYEINLETGSIEFKNRTEIIDSNKAYKINYQLNSGNFEENTNVVYEFKKGETVGFVNPVKEGAAFDGWYLTSDFSGTNLTQTTKDMQSDITLYAKWINESNADYFTYSTSGGQDAITGLTELGKTAYNEGREDFINLVIPKKSNKGNLIYAINQGVFRESKDPKIKKVIIHDKVTSLGNTAFYGCSNLKELTIPISLNASNSNVFSGCTGIEKINITKGNGESIDYETGGIYYYLNLPWYISSQNHDLKITLEEGITKIENYMFYNCKKMQMVQLPTTIQIIGYSAFYGCSGMQGEFNKIDKVTSLGAYAFYGCTGLTGEVIIPNEITSIGAGTFRDTKIEKLIIHDKVTSLGNTAFYGCSNLKELTIPISLNASNSNVFSGCTGIEKINITKGNGESIDYETGGIYYYSNLPWYISRRENDLKIIFNKDIVSIGNYMFYGINNAKFYYRGSQEEWTKIPIGIKNEFNIEQYNYQE